MEASKYYELINSYLSGKTNADDFIVEYNRQFLAEVEMDFALFEILEEIYEDAEAYSPLWLPCEEDDFHLSEETFYKLLVSNREKLKEYLNKYDRRN